MTREPDTGLRSLRALMILEALARIGVPATPTEVNRSLGLPKQTLHRAFGLLLSEGYVQLEHDGRSYSPGRRLRTMAAGVISSTRVRAARLAVMTALSERIGETCNLAIPDRDSMVYLDRVETRWPLRIHLPIGSSVPFHCTASGKLYLSTLDPRRLERILRSARFEPRTPRSIIGTESLRTEIRAIREKGHAEDDEEFIEGMVAVAVPVRDPNGRMTCSLSIHAPVQRVTLEVLRTHLPDLHQAADELSNLLIEEP